MGEYISTGASCCTDHIKIANNEFTCCKDVIRGKWDQDKFYPNMYLKLQVYKSKMVRL